MLFGGDGQVADNAESGLVDRLNDCVGSRGRLVMPIGGCGAGLPVQDVIGPRSVLSESSLRGIDMSTIAVPSAPTAGRRSFANLGVGPKILAAISVAVLVGAVVGVLGLQALSRASSSAQGIYTNNVAGVGATGNIRSGMAQARVDLANHALSATAADRAKYRQNLTKVMQNTNAAIAAYRANNPAGRRR